MVALVVFTSPLASACTPNSITVKSGALFAKPSSDFKMLETTKLINNEALVQTYKEASDSSKVEAFTTPFWENFLNIHLASRYVGKLVVNSQQPVDETQKRVDLVLKAHNSGRPVIHVVCECKRRKQVQNQLVALEEQLDDYGLFLNDLDGGLDSSNPFYGLACYGTEARLFKYMQIAGEKHTTLDAMWGAPNKKGDKAGYKDPGKMADVKAFEAFFQMVFASAGLLPTSPTGSVSNATGTSSAMALIGGPKMSGYGSPVTPQYGASSSGSETSAFMSKS